MRFMLETSSDSEDRDASVRDRFLNQNNNAGSDESESEIEIPDFAKKPGPKFSKRRRKNAQPQKSGSEKRKRHNSLASEAGGETMDSLRQKAARTHCHRSILPPLKGTLEHERKDYLIELIEKRENTIYTVYHDDDTSTEYYVSNQVMAQLILTNKFEADTDTEGKVILLPKSERDLQVALNQVRILEVNEGAKRVLELYPYFPEQHDLPECCPPESFKLKFDKWDVGLPSAANLRIFLFAPSNFRYNGLSYAANCRHQTASWDEHPWCPACWAEAKLPDCTEANCYICKRMGPRAKRRMLKKLKWWRDAFAENKERDVLTRGLPHKCMTQLQCDFASYKHCINPEWEKGYLGFCRPSWAIPIYTTTSEHLEEDGLYEDSVIEEQKLIWLREYELMQNGNVDLPWSDFGALQLDAIEKKNAVKAAKASKSKPTSAKVGSEVSVSANNLTAVGTSDKSDPGAGPSALSATSEASALNIDTTMNDEFSSPTGRIKGIKQRRKAKPGQWRHKSRVVCFPQSDRHRSSAKLYNEAAEATLRARPNSGVRRISTPDSSDQEGVEAELVRDDQYTYTPAPSCRAVIDQTLWTYHRNVNDPDFDGHLPVCLEDYPVDGIRATAPAHVPSIVGTLPTDADKIKVYQREIVRLHSLCHAMCKVHENDKLHFDTMWEETRTKEKARPKGTPLSDDAKVKSALRANFLKRDALIGQTTGIVTAIRRRDNGEQLELSHQVLSTRVARPINEDKDTLV